MIHDFVNHDVARERGGVGLGGGGRGEFLEAGRAVGITTEGNAVGLRAKDKSVDHAGLVRVHQHDVLAGGTEGEAKLGLLEGHKATRRNDQGRRDAELVRRRIVREPRAAEVDGLAAGVEQFDEVLLRRIGMREEFVDDHPAHRLGAHWFQATGRAVDGIARRPGLALVLAEAGTREHQRVPRAIRGGGPRVAAVVIHFQQDEVVIVPQPNLPTIIRQALGEWAEHARDAVNQLNVRWHSRDDDEAAALQNRAGREGVVDVARKPVAGDVLVEGIRVVDFHELQLGLVGPDEHVARVIHDFRDDQAGLPTRRPQRFGARRHGVDGAARRGRELVELRDGRLVCSVAGDGEPEIKPVRQRDAD